MFQKNEQGIAETVSSKAVGFQPCLPAPNVTSAWTITILLNDFFSSV